MTALIALFATTFTYALPEGNSRYLVTLLYDGYLPVMGGLEQKAKVEIGLLLERKEEGLVRTSLDSLSVALRNIETGEWATLPFNADSVRDFFPSSSIKFEPTGKILETDMPRTELPMRLPGLDLQHIPDVTFMLLEFPPEALEEGGGWRYERRFGDSVVRYKAVYEGQDEKGERFGLEISQEFETKEDENNNPTRDESEVFQVVKTKVEGKGTVWFRGSKGWISSAEVTAEAVSHVYSLKAGDPVGQRRLQTQFKIDYRGQDK